MNSNDSIADLPDGSGRDRTPGYLEVLARIDSTHHDSPQGQAILYTNATTRWYAFSGVTLCIVF